MDERRREYESFGSLLRYLRKKRGYSLRQIEKKAYIGKSLIERYEQGTALPPSKQTVDCLTKSLGCSPQDASALESIWLVDLLETRGVDRERAQVMVLSSEKLLADIDLAQIIWTAHEAIDHDAFEKALDLLEPVGKLHQSLEAKSPSIQFHLGEAKYGSGHVSEAGECFRQALHLLEHDHSAPRLQGFLAICVVVVQQAWFRIRPAVIFRRRRSVHGAQDETTWRMIVDACYRLAYIHHINNDRGLAIYYSLKGLNLAEASPGLQDSQNYQALFFANVATATGTAGIHSLARIYIRRIQALEGALDAPRARYGVDLVLGVYLFGQARWEECEARLERAARIAEEAGNLRHARVSNAYLASAYFWKGRWDESVTLFNHLYRRAKQCGDHQIMAVAIYSKALTAFHQGRLDYALRFARIAECFAREKSQDNLVQIQVNGLLVAICFHQNKLDEAQYHADVVENLSKLTSTTAGTLEGYHRLSEYYLRRWEACGSRNFREGSKRAVKLMAAHARIFDVFRPLYWTYKGWYEFLSGKRTKGVKLVSRGIREAQVLRMPYHESLAQQCLASLTASVGDPAEKQCEPSM